MANCVFGWPIYSDDGRLYTPTLSSGSAWVSTLPLNNLKDSRLHKVARTTTLTPEFDIDLGVARAVRVLAVIIPNLSSTGTVRVRGSSVAGDFTSPVYDSGVVTVYPSTKNAESMVGYKPTFIAVPSAEQTARYWRVTVSDPANGYGYIDFARLVIAGGWQPSYNMEYGASIGLEHESESVYTEGASAIHVDRPRRRNWQFQIKGLPDAEAYQRSFDMMFIAGTSQQMFFVFDPNDTALMMHYRAFLGTLKVLNPLEHTFYDQNAASYQITEEL